ncbi:hypothetical protein [Streptomyces anulatus]|uniref:zinc finger domain-containing protein n=1 Tax=Streptomyces anulatus TaxID=1892 RepID=UPI0038682654
MNTQPDPTPAVQASRDAARRSAVADRVAAAARDMATALDLQAAGPCTDPRHTGPIRAQLGCTGPDPAETVPRTERAYWQDITDALNALHTAGGSIGIDLDGTLTDHRAWSVVWDRDNERWTLAGYDDEPEGTKEAPAAEQPTDGAESPEDAARRFARRLAAVEQLCSGRPGYHTVTVKSLLTAMGEADDEDQEQPLAAWLTGADAGPPAPVTAADEPAFLDPFTEAAVRRGALLGGADAIEALPQDHECDPGRGDAVKLLRRLAGLTTTTEQPTGLTWEARAEHAVRLYATTAIELEDARRDNARLRAERDEVIQQRDRITNDTMAALTTAAEQRDNLDFNRGDTVAAVRDALLDPNEHTPETALAAARVLLAAHTRLLADEASERLTDRDAEMRADGYRGRVAWCSGMREAVKLLGGRAAAIAPAPAPAPQPDAAEEQPLAFPQLAVPCPQCDAPARQLCTSHSGTRQRTNNTHQDRTKAYRAQAGR